MNITVARFFTVYGPRCRPDMMPRLLLQSATTGEPVPLFRGDLSRDWTYVDDVCEGIISASDRASGFNIVNLGRGQPVSLQEFIQTLRSESGRPLNLVDTRRPPTELLSTWADITHARQLLDYNPETDIELGIKKMWQWWQTVGCADEALSVGRSNSLGLTK